MCLCENNLLAIKKYFYFKMYIPLYLPSKSILILVILLMQFSLCFCIPSSSMKKPTHLSCEPVKNILLSRGFANEIPVKPLHEISLRYCYPAQSETCCSQNMELKLVNLARTQLEKSAKESIQKLTTILKVRAQKFNEHFKMLLNNSKREFHEMFKRTYGVIYEQNAHVFSDLFNELESYYLRGKVDLIEAMDSFFNILYQKMFTVINMQYQFDDKYLGCVSEHMKPLKPFGDVPDKLSVILKRSFVATRTYAQSLSIASEITRNLQNVRLTPDCISSLASLHVCGLCSGNVEKPCSSFCLNVMKSCFQQPFSELNFEWDNYVAAMDKLSDRLLGPFNIVMVVEPINIKISEAIMNFQDSGQEITNKIFQECGKPKLQGSLNRMPRSTFISMDDFIKNRRKRAMKQDSRHYESFENSGSKNRRKNKNKRPNEKNYQEENREPTMDKLIKDIRQKVKDSKKFWSNLPYQMCNNEDLVASSNMDNKCWTQKQDSIHHKISTENKNNMDGSQQTASARYSNLISQHLYKLRAVNNHLKNAFNGMDVEWSDQDDSYYENGSGSGSGIDDDDDYGSGFGEYTAAPNPPQSPKIQSSDEKIHGYYTESPKPDLEVTFINPIKPGYSSTSPTPSDASGMPTSPMTPLKAAIVYLLPIFVAWFGGIFSDLL